MTYQSENSCQGDFFLHINSGAMGHQLGIVTCQNSLALLVSRCSTISALAWITSDYQGNICNEQAELAYAGLPSAFIVASQNSLQASHAFRRPCPGEATAAASPATSAAGLTAAAAVTVTASTAATAAASSTAAAALSFAAVFPTECTRERLHAAPGPTAACSFPNRGTCHSRCLLSIHT